MLDEIKSDSENTEFSIDNEDNEENDLMKYISRDPSLYSHTRISKSFASNTEGLHATLEENLSHEIQSNLKGIKEVAKNYCIINEEYMLVKHDLRQIKNNYLTNEPIIKEQYRRKQLQIQNVQREIVNVNIYSINNC